MVRSTTYSLHSPTVSWISGKLSFLCLSKQPNYFTMVALERTLPHFRKLIILATPEKPATNDHETNNRYQGADPRSHVFVCGRVLHL